MTQVLEGSLSVLWVTSLSTVPFPPPSLGASAPPDFRLSPSLTLPSLLPPSASVSPSVVCDGPGAGVRPHAESQVHAHTLSTCVQVLNPQEYPKCKCMCRDVQAHCACTCVHAFPTSGLRPRSSHTIQLPIGRRFQGAHNLTGHLSALQT